MFKRFVNQHLEELHESKNDLFLIMHKPHKGKSYLTELDISHRLRKNCWDKGQYNERDSFIPNEVY